MAVSIRTLSQLPEVSANSLMPNAYLEVSNPVSVDVDASLSVKYVYGSKKIKKSELSKSIIRDVRTDLETTNKISDQDFGWLYDDHNRLISDEYTLTGTKHFENNPTHADEISSFQNDDLNDYSVNLNALKKYSNLNSAPTISPTFGFVTHLSGDNNKDAYYNIFRIDRDGNNITATNKPSFVFSPESAKVLAQNEFVFRIKQEEKKSNIWEAPASGIFTCYGWLDEIHNEKVSNENRWVALLGLQQQLGTWTILQVQPFVKNNYLSYVGFTFPVHKGMKLRIATGFAVGSNSDKYFKIGDSLANNVANAFLGGVYTGLSVDTGGDYNLSFENIEPQPVAPPFDPADLYNLICTQISHETSCDVETEEKIDYLSSEIDNRVKFINTEEYTAKPVCINLRMYNRMFSPTTGNEDTNYTQECFNKDRILTSNAPLLSVTLDELATKMVSRYYAPPTFAETLENGQIGYVERAYTREGLQDLYGRVFSDGKYMFYCVSQDCTVIIHIYGDITSYGSSTVGFMLLPHLKQVSGPNAWQKIGAVTLGNCMESRPNVADTPTVVTLPVKKGTIFMFCSSHTQNLNPLFAGVQLPSTVRELFKCSSCPAIYPGYNSAYTSLSSIYSTNSHTNSALLEGTYVSYNSYYLWTSDESQRANLVGDSSDKFTYLFGNDSSHGDNSSTTIASIVELP